jgi:hypothetical protein
LSAFHPAPFRNQTCFSMWMTGSDSPFTSGIEMGFTAT